MEEKTKRNEQIYMDKMGYNTIFDTKPSKKPLSYRELGEKYHLSVTFLQKKVNVYKNKVEKKT